MEIDESTPKSLATFTILIVNPTRELTINPTKVTKMPNVSLGTTHCYVSDLVSKAKNRAEHIENPQLMTNENNNNMGRNDLLNESDDEATTPVTMTESTMRLIQRHSEAGLNLTDITSYPHEVIELLDRDFSNFQPT